MKSTISNIILPANTWVNIYLAPAIVAAGIVVGDRLSFVKIKGSVDLNFGATKPEQDAGFTPLQEGFDISNSLGSLGAWAISRNNDGLINVSENVTAEMPNGLFTNNRAMTVQTYTEGNSKQGYQHEYSVYIPALAAGATSKVIFVTGNKPVIIKARIASYTGAGLVLGVNQGATFTGGTPTPSYNATTINPVSAIAGFIVGATIISDGVKAFADEFLIGNTSQQGKGGTLQIAGRERVLKPNTTFMFYSTSLDNQAQAISFFDSWYEGDLDFPL